MSEKIKKASRPESGLPWKDYDFRSYEEHSVKSWAPFIESEHRSVGHASPQVTYRLGLSPENSSGVEYYLPMFSDFEERGYLPEALSVDSVAEYLKACAEASYWNKATGGKPDMSKAMFEMVAWGDLSAEDRQTYLESQRITDFRTQSKIVDQACRQLE